MQTLQKTLAGICAILFVITGVMALLLFNIERKAFSAATYKQAFEQQNLYERMPAILANALSTSIAENAGNIPYLKGLTVQDWQTTLSFLLPPQELRAMTDDTLDSLFDYVNGKTDTAVISLLPLKNHLTEDSGVEVVKQILSKQPACTTDQLLQIGLGLISGSDLILCNPPQEAMGLITPIIEAQLRVVTSAIPDKITLTKTAQSGTPNDPRVNLNRIRWLMKLSPLLPLLFLFSITIFIVRSIADWLKWWGWPFIVAGLVGLLVAIPGSYAFGLILKWVIQNKGSTLIPPILISTMEETAGTVARQILKPVVIEGLILLLIGITMVIIEKYFAPKNSK